MAYLQFRLQRAVLGNYEIFWIWYEFKPVKAVAVKGTP
jgi:hypothetical protein